jgi:hypothetical protein
MISVSTDKNKLEVSLFSTFLKIFTGLQDEQLRFKQLLTTLFVLVYLDEHQIGLQG